MSKKHRLSRNISRVVALVAIGISVVAATNPSRLLIDSVKEFFGAQDSQRNEYSAETARTVNRPYAPQATLFDSFADGDFTASPVWGGSTGSWTVVANSDASSGATGSNTLRLSAPGVSQTDYLSSQISSWGTSQEWGFWVGRRAQAFTLANQQYFWLYANEATLNNATVDGYRIAIGDDTGNDEIRLEYIVNGAVSSTVITSSGSVPNALTDIGFLVRVTRSSSGAWEIFTSALPTSNGTGAIATAVPDAAGAATSQGTGINNSLVPASNGYLGVAALHSTSAAATAAAEFDQIYFTAVGSGGTPTKLAITAISPASPTAGSGFNVTVQSQDGSNVPSNVTASTGFTLSNAGGGAIGGTTTGTISAATNSVVVTGVTLSAAATGATLTATRSSGDNLTAGTSAPFDVLAAADHIAFVGVPTTGAVNGNLAAFTVEARRPDNTVDTTFAANVVVTRASGSGTLSGTGTKPATAGVATFNDLQFNTADTYTLNANSGPFPQILSGNIVVSDASLASDFFRSAASSGNWGSSATWESSHDGSTGWTAATLSPDNNANAITIRNGHVVTIAASVSADQITVDPGGQITIGIGNVLTLANGSGTDLVVNGTVLNSGTFTIASSTWSLNAGGIFIQNTSTGVATQLAAGTLDAASNFIYRGSSTPSVSGRTYGNLSFESASGLASFSGSGSGTLTINGSLSVGATGAGTVAWNLGGYSGPINIAGAVLIGSGSTLTLGSSTLTLNGNWSNSGTLAPGASTVIFGGPTGQTISGNTTFNNLTKSVSAAQTMNFTSGSLTTVSSSLTLTGATGNLLALRSTAPGTQWLLHAPATQSVNFVDVSDSNANGGQTVAPTNTVDSGNNLNWAFPPPAAADHITFVGVPSSGGLNANLASFTVEARRPDNSVDIGYSANVVITKASGLGTLSGTATKPAVNGVATFTALQFDAVDTYTLHADSGAFGQITSSSIVITDTSAASDFFRSAATGPWNAVATWQSSHDGVTNWTPATLVPDVNANTITIRSGHTVTINSSINADETIISSGGTLLVDSSAGGMLNLADGAGDDLTISNGGIFQITGTHSYSTTIVYTGNADINVNSGGKITVGDGTAATTGASYGNLASVAGQVIWSDGSIFEWNTSGVVPASSGVTWFPGVAANVVPIFRYSALSGAALLGSSASSTSTVNGRLEVNTPISWQGTGTKTFRNGITGTASITQTSTGTFSVNGATAQLGGAGSISLNAAGALTIGGTTTTSLISNKQIDTGTITVSGTLNCDANALTGSAAFNLVSAATLGLGSSNGISTTPAIGNIQLAGSRIFNAGSTFVYNGNVNQNAGNGLPASVTNLTIANTGGSGSNIVTGNTGQAVTGLLLVQMGIYSSAGSYNNVQIQPAGTLSLTGAITVSGNWTNNGGIFVANGNGVVLNGATGQTISGNNNFYDLTKSTTSAQTLNFVASGAQTVTHSLILTGTAGNALSLRSTSSPAQWKLNAPSTQSLSFLNVKDSDASGGQLVTPANSIDSGNNINWNFNAVFPPTKLAITAIAPTTPTAGSSFDVTVQSQDGAGGPANIAANTGFTLSNTGGGLIGGATSGTIAANTSVLTVTRVTLSSAGTGITLTAARTSGDILTAGTSAPFNVLAAANHIAFSSVPSTGIINSSLASFAVQALRPDNSVDTTYNGNVVLTRATGSGTLSGTTTKAAAAGVATFSDIQFSVADTYTLHADSDSFGQITSGNIAIADASAATDFFRSVITGAWNAAATWESSHDGVTNWMAATLAPTSSANMITIRAGHTVTINTTVIVDEVMIAGGGVLLVNSTSGTLNLADGPGDDLVVSNGGILQVIGTGSFGSKINPAGNANFNINSGGKVTIGDGTAATTGSGYGSFASSPASVVVWNDGSVFEWNTSGASPATSGVTWFPGTAANVIPMARFSALDPATLLGSSSSSSTTINGLLEVNTPIGWQGTGNKTFRNGIIGSAALTQTSTGTFIINGASAQIGGAGSIELSPTGSMTIASGAVASLVSNKILSAGTLIVASNGRLNCGTTMLSGSGAFILAAGGTLGIGDANGITNGASGNIQTATRSFDNSTATYIYNGAVNQAVGNALPASVGNLTIANLGSTGNNVVIGNPGQTVTELLLVQVGIYSGASAYDNVQIDAGGTLSLTGSITVGGDWSNGGTFAANGNGVTLNGPTGQTISGNTTFYSLAKSATSTQNLNFSAASTTTVTNSLAFTGAAGNLLSLKSTVSPTQWKLNAPSTQTLSFLNVKDSDASGGQTVNAIKSVNSGNNTNWFFTPLQPGTLAFTSAQYSFIESGPAATITVSRMGGSDGIVGANFATVAGGTATGGSNCGGTVDYRNTSGKVSFGDSVMTQTFSVPICNDDLFENDETVNLVLTAPTGGAVLGSPNTAVLTINDNDAPPSFSIDDVTHNEGNSGPTPYTFHITKSGSTALNASVVWSTADDTAASPVDFTAISATTLNFLPADTSKQVTVLVRGDTIFEPDETFLVRLSSPVNATITRADGIGTITNDDPAPVNISGNIRQFDGSNPATSPAGVTVKLSGSAALAATTDTNGNYSFPSLPYSGFYVVTPSRAGKIFEPLSRIYNSVTADIANADFKELDVGMNPRVLTIRNGYAMPGQSAIVPIDMAIQGDESTVAFSLNYEPTIISALQVKCGTSDPSCFVSVNTQVPGKLGITVMPTSQLAFGQRNIARIFFQTTSNAPQYAIVTFGTSPTAQSVKDWAGNPLPATFMSPGYVIFGKGVEGDIVSHPNGNGVVDSSDVVAVALLMAGLNSPIVTSNEFQRADCAPAATKGDGTIDTTDVIQASRYAAGLDGGPHVSAGGVFQPPEQPLFKVSGADKTETARRLRIISTNASPGGDVSVSVDLDSQGDEVAASFTLNFDTSKLEISGKSSPDVNPDVALGAGVPAGTGVVINAARSSAGKIGILLFNTSLLPFSPEHAPTRIAALRFHVKPDAPTGPTRIAFDNSDGAPIAQSMSDGDANPLDAIYEDGMVEIGSLAIPNVEISGRVMTASGRGIRSATITVSGDSLEQAISVATSSSGEYRVGGLPANMDYTVSVGVKRYTFRNPSRGVYLTANVDDMDFVADP